MSLTKIASLWARVKYYPYPLIKNQSFEEASIANWEKEVGVYGDVWSSTLNWSEGTPWATHGSYHLHASLNGTGTTVQPDSYAEAIQDVDTDKLDGIVFDYNLFCAYRSAGTEVVGRVYIGTILLLEVGVEGEVLNKVLRFGTTGIQRLRFGVYWISTLTLTLPTTDTENFLVDNIREIRKVFHPK